MVNTMELTRDQQITEIRSILRGRPWPFGLKDAKQLNYPLEFHWRVGDEQCSTSPFSVALPNGELFTKEQILENSIADHATERFNQLKVIREVLAKKLWPSGMIETHDFDTQLVFGWQGVALVTRDAPNAVRLMGESELWFTREEVIPGQAVIAPPLGLKPLSIHNAQRAADICQAISRYIDASKRVPAEWYEELQQLTDGFND